MIGELADGPGRSHFHFTAVSKSNLSGKDSVVFEEPLKLGPLQLFHSCPFKVKRNNVKKVSRLILKSVLINKI
jgi:hypothetical protein